MTPEPDQTPAAREQRDAGLVMLLNELGLEVERARRLHKPYNSHHEAAAVIWEELDEYWQQVKAWPKHHSESDMRAELLQVAATALRGILDLIDVDTLAYKPGQTSRCIHCSRQMVMLDTGQWLHLNAAQVVSWIHEPEPARRTSDSH